MPDALLYFDSSGRELERAPLGPEEDSPRVPLLRYGLGNPFPLARQPYLDR